MVSDRIVPNGYGGWSPDCTGYSELVPGPAQCASQFTKIPASTRCVEAVVERPRPSDRRDITGKERVRAGHTHTRAYSTYNIQYYTNAYSTVIQYYNTSGPAIQIVTLNSQCADLKLSP